MIFMEENYKLNKAEELSDNLITKLIRDTIQLIE